jgi:SAM-dependent methyltransferase
MPTYRLLIQRNMNRVYAQAAPAMAVAELRSLAALGAAPGLGDVSIVEVAGTSFIGFHAERPLDEATRRVIASASGAYVLFELVDGLFDPLPSTPIAVYPDDLLTTLKYSGKTNEQFTALLVNLALAASARGFDAVLAGERVRLLDPLCGRGTTLNQALMYGLDVVGIDAHTKDLEIYIGFLRQWLRDHHVKHRSEAMRVRKGRERTARRHTITITHRDGRGADQQLVDIINDDTVHTRDHLKGSSVDVIVGDLPYGVQHAARTDEWGRSRNPEGLLEAALPVWRGVLRGGGALCLAWNTRLLASDTMRELLHRAGFSPVALPDGVDFTHRVDRSITRDLVLAVKPGSPPKANGA